MTSRQQDALEFIRANQRVVTIGPSLRELASALGIAANAAQQKVTFLRREGLVAPNTGQGIVLASGVVEDAMMKRPRKAKSFENLPPVDKGPSRLEEKTPIRREEKRDMSERKPILRPSGKI